MLDVETRRASVLDRAVVQALKLDGEKLAWIGLLVVALLSRTIGLGDRAMSHDESLHTVYSWQLYRRARLSAPADDARPAEVHPERRRCTSSSA